MDEYDWDQLEQHVLAFRQDGRAELPCIDLLTDQEDRLTTDFRGIPILLLEGLYAIRASVDRRLFIDLTYRETKGAQVLRGKEPPDEFRWRVLEREHTVVQSLRGSADWIVSKDYQLEVA